MANLHGDFVWYELMTADPEAAKRFYDGVVGWTIGPPAMPDMDYRMIEAGDGHVGGVMRLTEEMTEAGAKPAWLGYVGVNDVDAAVVSVQHGGGAVHVAPTDIPGVGRFALLADPHGIPFYVMRGASDETSTAFSAKADGHCAWNELSTPDPKAALTFYGTRFGWTEVGSMPMGALGDYVFIGHGHDHEAIGAVMATPADGFGPGWRFYFRVPDIDAAASRIEAAGGTVLHGPGEVPGGDWVIQARDPEGTLFGLVGAKR